MKPLRSWRGMAAAFVLTSALIAACSSIPERAGELATDGQREATQARLHRELGLSIEVEDPMPRAALASITNAFFALRVHRFSVVPANHPFSRFFGSNQVQAVFGFMRERIHYLGVMDPAFDKPAPGNKVYAMNSGSALWRLKDSDYKAAIRQAGNRVDSINSPRYGLITLSPTALVAANEAKEPDSVRLAHLGAFVHEARHSDCPVGLGTSGSCTFPHAACKRGSRDQGAVVCDGGYWGAYSASYIALDGIISSCRDCDTLTLRTLKFVALENADRINPLPNELTYRIATLLQRAVRGEKLATLEPIASELLARTNAVMISQSIPRPNLSSANLVAN